MYTGRVGKTASLPYFLGSESSIFNIADSLSPTVAFPLFQSTTCKRVSISFKRFGIANAEQSHFRHRQSIHTTGLLKLSASCLNFLIASSTVLAPLMTVPGLPT